VLKEGFSYIIDFPTVALIVAWHALSLLWVKLVMLLLDVAIS